MIAKHRAEINKFLNMASSQKEVNMFRKTMGFYEDLILHINEAVSSDFGGKRSRLAKAAETHTSTLSRLVKGERNKWLNLISRIADEAGLRVVRNEYLARDVCFVDAKMVPAGEGSAPPQAENYMAVPMVGEVGAGPGIIDQNMIESWVLVYRHHRSVMRRSNLLAVEIGKNQRSMADTLYPGDIVLVDRNDWGEQTGYEPPGNIFLVREPGQEGGGMVKRVSMEGSGASQTIIFYSDNAKEYAPKPYSMSRYDYDIRNAIIGRVVWAWADLSKK
ncbi:MAG: S24/S26 family peptidase [Desulfovibrio sp.]|jgi:hypothetical protein|nr:S24/S26 family peptidase [Desulfovibrio sp.]